LQLNTNSLSLSRIMRIISFIAAFALATTVVYADVTPRYSGVAEATTLQTRSLRSEAHEARLRLRKPVDSEETSNIEVESNEATTGGNQAPPRRERRNPSNFAPNEEGDSDAATAGGEQQSPRHGERNPVTGQDTRSIQRRGGMTSEMIKKAGMPSFDFANAQALPRGGALRPRKDSLTTNTISNRPRRGAFSIDKPGKGPISTSMIKEIERQSSFGTGPTSKVQQEHVEVADQNNVVRLPYSTNTGIELRHDTSRHTTRYYEFY
jgi:hypothetical protein